MDSDFGLVSSLIYTCRFYQDANMYKYQGDGLFNIQNAFCYYKTNV